MAIVGISVESAIALLAVATASFYFGWKARGLRDFIARNKRS